MKKMKKMKGSILLVVSVLIIGVLMTGCTNVNSTAGNSNSNSLSFMFWGSPFEKNIQIQQAQEFSKQNKVNVSAQIIPSDFQTKLNTLMASGNMPDMSYLGAGQALIWGQQGHILNLAPYEKKDPQLQGWLPESHVYWAPGKFTTLSTIEMETLYYNPSIFKKANIAPPPDNESNAWTWDQFVATAQALTVDKNGKHPNDPGFDPNHIVQYGVNMPIEDNYDGWYDYLLSSGGSITNAAGTKYTMNSPEAVRAFQDLHDLIWKYHVMPSPAQSKNLPGTDQALETGKYAMIMDGQWMLLDFNQQHIKFGIGVLPKIEQPANMLFSGAQPIYSNTKNPDAAVKFLEFEDQPTGQLVTNGLWMPLQQKYYTDPKLIKTWAYNSAHPEPQFKNAIIDSVINYGASDPGNILKNFPQIDNTIEQKLDLIWANQAPVKQVLDQIGQQVTPLLQGTYPTK